MADESDGFDDDGFEGGGSESGRRMSRFVVPEIGPALVTLTVFFAGIALVVSSIIWHPHV